MKKKKISSVSISRAYYLLSGKYIATLESPNALAVSPQNRALPCDSGVMGREKEKTR